MTNDEIRMTKKHRPTEAAAIRHQSFELRHSFVIRAYSFVILPMHPTFHRLIFWGHLIVGIVAGLVILSMAISGLLIAYEVQFMDWANRDLRVSPSAENATRLGIENLLTRGREIQPGQVPSGITWKADPAMPVTLTFGREGIHYLDPYTGKDLGSGAKAWHDFFHAATDWHRFLTQTGLERPIGKAITGAGTLLFGLLLVSGIYLWWPRHWRRLIAGEAEEEVVCPAVAHDEAGEDDEQHGEGAPEADDVVPVPVAGAAFEVPVEKESGAKIRHTPVAGPPGGEAFALLQPHGVDAITCAIDVLLHGALQAEDEVVARVCEPPCHGFREGDGAHGAPGFDGHLMHGHSLGSTFPAFGVEMDVMPCGNQRAEQPLQIQLSSAHRGELTADEGELHGRDANGGSKPLKIESGKLKIGRDAALVMSFFLPPRLRFLQTMLSRPAVRGAYRVRGQLTK